MMTLDPLLSAPWVVQIHAFSAMGAFFLGVIQFSAPKGTMPHKTLGALFIILMILVTVSSIFIRPAIDPGLPFLQWFGPIHIFTGVTAFGLVGGIYWLRKGGPTLHRHSRPFLGIFIGGLIVAGALAFLPGRIMNSVLFGGIS